MARNDFLASMFAFFAVACAPVEDDVRDVNPPTQVGDTGLLVGDEWPIPDDTGSEISGDPDPVKLIGLVERPLDYDPFVPTWVGRDRIAIVNDEVIKSRVMAGGVDVEQKGFAADMDADGIQDLVLVESLGHPSIVFGNLAVDLAGTELLVLEDILAWQISAIDVGTSLLDPDGDLDLVIATAVMGDVDPSEIVTCMSTPGSCAVSYDIRLQILENVGARQFRFAPDITGSLGLNVALATDGVASDVSSLHIMDVNGDGLPDITMRGKFGEHFARAFHSNARGGFDLVDTWSYDRGFANGGHTITDVDFDGKREEISHSFDASEPSSLVMGGAFRQYPLYPDVPHDVSDMGGTADVLDGQPRRYNLASDIGCIHVGTFAGASVTNTQFPEDCYLESGVVPGPVILWNVRTIDLDGDGRRDIVASVGTEYVYPQMPGRGPFIWQNLTEEPGEIQLQLRQDWLHNASVTSERGLILVDLDGDGDLDVFPTRVITGTSGDSDPRVLENTISNDTYRISFRNWRGHAGAPSVTVYYNDGTRDWPSSYGDAGRQSSNLAGAAAIMRWSQVEYITLDWFSSAPGKPKRQRLEGEELRLRVSQRAAAAPHGQLRIEQQ